MKMTSGKDSVYLSRRVYLSVNNRLKLWRTTQFLAKCFTMIKYACVSVLHLCWFVPVRQKWSKFPRSLAVTYQTWMDLLVARVDENTERGINRGGFVRGDYSRLSRTSAFFVRCYFRTQHIANCAKHKRTTLRRTPFLSLRQCRMLMSL